MFFLDKFLAGIKPRFDDDIVDRLNYYYTPMLLIILSLTMSAKQYVGQAIQCWVPAQFTGAWEQYTENYCFVQNTYFLPLTDDIPRRYQTREDREIGYYQWVPFVLALMAVLFFLPALIWRLFNWQSGINVKSIIKMALESKDAKVDTSDREKNVNTLAAHLADSLDLQRDLGQSNRICGFMFYGKHHGIFVTVLYLFMKLMFLINVIGQFFILNSFLGFPDHKLWGYEVLKDLANGREWQESGHFPRVTMCDFEVRVLGNLHRHTVQCVLQINMFNEKVFVFLWWWFIIVAIATAINLLMWGYGVLTTSERSFLTRYLRITEGIKRDDRKYVESFIKYSLRPDGILLLRLIAANAGDIVTTDLIHALWASYRDKNPPLPPPPHLTAGKEFYSDQEKLALLKPDGMKERNPDFYPIRPSDPTAPPVPGSQPRS